MEKMKPGTSLGARAEEETNGIKDQEDVSVPPQGGDEILYNLHHATERHRKERVSREEVSTYHKSIERSEFGPLFEQYKQGDVPGPERMFGPLKAQLDKAQGIIDEEHAASGEGSVAELVRIHGLLAGREQEVSSAASRYVQALIRHRNLQQLSLGGSRDLTEQFVRADHARRRAHEALLASLRLYRDMLQKAKEEELIPANSYVEWQIGDKARDIPQQTIVVFSAKTTADRDFVRDWALVIDFANQLNELERENG